MNIDAIEEGIERNTDKWRSKYMNLAFCNVYDPIIFDVGFEERPEIDPEFKENWMKMRLFEYYQEHKYYVDKYGQVLPEMTMSKEEKEKLKEYLDIKGEERLEILENSSKKENKKHIKSATKW